MKRLFLPAMAALAVLCTACDNKSEQTFNTLGFYPTDNGLRAYADQVQDTSYKAVATQSWTVTSNAAWLTLTPESGQVREGRIAQTTLQLQFSPNTTGTTRSTTLTLRSGTGVVSKPISQLSLLHLPKTTLLHDEATGDYQYSKYIGQDSTANNTTLALRLYTQTAKVRSEEAWIRVDTTAVYNIGDTVVPVTLQRNLSTDRHGYVILYTPSGITTKVRIQQASQG